MGCLCNGSKKRNTASDICVQPVILSRSSNTKTSIGYEESKQRKSKTEIKASVKTRSFSRKTQKADTRSSTNSLQNECLGAKIIDRAKSANEIAAISETLSKNFVLARLSDEDKLAMIEKMLFITVDPGKVIYEADNSPMYFYIISVGTIAELSNGEKVAELHQGDSFGELALINRCPRKTTVRAVQRSHLWALDRESFIQALEGVNKAIYEENLAFVRSVPLFEMLTSDEIEILLNSMTELKYIAGQKIVREGDAGDLFYVIKDGAVLCTENGIEIRHMSKGDFFGEQALIYNSPRTATVTAVENIVKCLALSRDVLFNAMGDHLNNVIYRNSVKVAFTRSQIFNMLTEEQAEQLSQNCRYKEFAQGDVVIPENTPIGKSLWFVLKGSLESIDNRLQSLSIFGDTALLTETDALLPQFTAAEPNTYVATISRSTLETTVSCSLATLISKNEAMAALKNVELYHNLSRAKLSALTSLLTIETFEIDQDVFIAGTQAERFYIIKSGSVNVKVNGEVVRVIHPLGYFGERAMLQREVRSATVVANEATECWVLKRDDFFSVIDDHIRKLLLKKIDLQDDTVVLDDLQMGRCLGGGMFGKVYLTHHRTKQAIYALKVVEKARMLRLSNLKSPSTQIDLLSLDPALYSPPSTSTPARGVSSSHLDFSNPQKAIQTKAKKRDELKLDVWKGLLLERDILMRLNHIFVMKLVKTMEDDKFAYLLMEYVQGKDFFDVIREMGLLSDNDARFYTASLLLILEYLQEKKIVYRDLKPENIMIDEDGYPKLIDFGTAKVVEGRTYTIVGTPHYMAPELISGKGYNLSADLWSLGIILYEMLCGSVPFGEDDEDPYSIYQKILTDRLTYPSFISSKLKCKPLIETLCNRNPVLRSGGKVERLKSHPWFASVIWVRLT